MPAASFRIPASLKREVRDFFLPHMKNTEGRFSFPYLLDGMEVAAETWNANGNLVPSTAGIWLAAGGLPAQVRHLFIGYSAADILCFCHFNVAWLRGSGNPAFTALGLLPIRSQILELKRRFPHAKIHTLFDAYLTGRIADCKIALWLAKREAAFRIEGDVVAIMYRNRRFVLSTETFSLNRFEKVTGLRSGIRTHKPKGQYSSDCELFAGQFTSFFCQNGMFLMLAIFLINR